MIGTLAAAGAPAATGVPPELILFIGGGVVTVAVAVFVIVLIVRANREHEREVERERTTSSAKDAW